LQAIFNVSADRADVIAMQLQNSGLIQMKRDRSGNELPSWTLAPSV